MFENIHCPLQWKFYVPKSKKKFFYFDDLHVLMPLSSLKIRISSNQIYPGRSHPCSFVCNIDINSKILFHIFISWSLKFKFTKALWQLIVKEIIELMFRYSFSWVNFSDTFWTLPNSKQIFELEVSTLALDRALTFFTCLLELNRT